MKSFRQKINCTYLNKAVGKIETTSVFTIINPLKWKISLKYNTNGSGACHVNKNNSFDNSFPRENLIYSRNKFEAGGKK